MITAAAVGLGAIAGGYLLLTGSKKPKSVLCVRPGEVAGPLAYVEDGWTEHLGNFHAVSVKVGNGSKAWKVAPGPLLEGAASAGVERWGWSYNYVRNRDQAAREAAAVIEAIELWNLDAYCINCEHHTYGAWGAPTVADVPGNILAFIRAIREGAPGTPIYWNGLGWIKYENSAGQYQQGLTPEIMSLMTGYMPMIYKKGADTAKRRAKTNRTWRKSAAKSAAWGLPFCPMVGTGALTGDGTTSWLWTFDKDGAPGHLSNVAQMQPDVVAFFYGYGSKPQLSVGNAHNPALDVLAELQWQARDGRVASAADMGMTP